MTPTLPVEPTGATVLACWGGVTVYRGIFSIWLVTESYVDPESFQEALRLLGLVGGTDYETTYDPGTGRETFIFDGTFSPA